MNRVCIKAGESNAPFHFSEILAQRHDEFLFFPVLALSLAWRQVGHQNGVALETAEESTGSRASRECFWSGIWR